MNNAPLTTDFLALITWDTMTSFSQEMRCIWGRRIGTVTFLYVGIRYVTLIQAFLHVFDQFFVSETIAVSDVFTLYQKPLAQVLLRGISFLRIYVDNRDD